MLIGIHSQAVFKKEKTGVEKYAHQLIKNIAMLPGSKEHRFVLYSDNYRAGNIDLPENFSVKVLRSPYLWTQFRLALYMLFKKPKALFIPAHVLPALSHPKNSTVMIHDIAFEFFPQAYPDFHRKYLRFTTKHALKRAKKIIVPSKSTADDLAKFYEVDMSKVFVVHHGGIDKEAEKFSKEQLEFPYFLYIGRLELKKNILGILKAFDLFKGAYKSAHKLVLVGNFGFGKEKIKEAIAKHRYKNDIVLTGWVDDVNKDYLLSNADMFLFPSLYEGFGLPILEAQAFGVPLITSCISSMPEVAGKGAILVNPHNSEEMADAMIRIMSDENLKNDLMTKGRENLKRFSWKDCARETLEIIVSK